MDEQLDVRVPTDMSEDGEWVLVTTLAGDIFALRTGGGNQSRWPPGASYEQHGAFSHDGRWVAYSTDVSGRPEVEVRPFRETGQVRQVSNAGGAMPAFSRDSQALYYWQGGALFETVLAPGASLALSAARLAIARGVPSQQNGPGYSSVDDQRFLVSTLALGDSLAERFRPELVVVLNWLNEVERLVPLP